MSDASDETAPADPAVKAAMAQAGLQKLQAEARKAGADASAAEVTARGGALKAAIGEVAGSGLAGSVTTTDGAGLAEGNALAITALRTIAAAIATKLAALAPADNILLVLGKAASARTAASAFDFQEKLVARALADALAATTLTPRPAPEHDAVKSRTTSMLTASMLGGSAFTPAGLVLSGVSAVLSYARTDFALAGRELKPNDRMLLSAVAAGLIAAGKTVRLDELRPPPDDATCDDLIDRIETLATAAASVRERAGTYRALIALGGAKPAPPAGSSHAASETATKPPHEHHADEHLPQYQRAVQTLDAATATFDAFYTSLLADDGTGPLVLRIAQAIAAERFVAAGAVGMITLDGAYSSTLSRKNLLSGLFGHVPYEINALATASWQLVDGKTAALLGAGVEAELLPYQPLLEVKLAKL